MSHARLSPEQAHARLLQGAAYLDVRTQPEFDLGHPEGAVCVPWQVPGAHGLEANPRFLDQVRAHFDRDQPLVVGCATGVRSRAACEALLQAGFHDVAEQRAGFDGVRDPFGTTAEKGWRELGLPVATRRD